MTNEEKREELRKQYRESGLNIFEASVKALNEVPLTDEERAEQADSAQNNNMQSPA